jgi:hypothetical protein
MRKNYLVIKMPATIYKLEKGVRHRKRTVFPPPHFRKREKIIQVRVSAEAKTNLKWLARKRDEPLGTMLGLYADLLADVAEQLHASWKAKKIVDDPSLPIGIHGYIEVGGFEEHRISLIGYRRMPSAFLEARMDIENRLYKLYGSSNAKIMVERIIPELGCSIEQAIKERRFRDVAKVVRNWERQAKAFA